MKKSFKKLILLTASLILCGCDFDLNLSTPQGNSDSGMTSFEPENGDTDTGDIAFASNKYKTKSAESLNNGYTLQKSFRDIAGNQYYMFYLGRIYDVPLQEDSGFYFQYTGGKPTETWEISYATEESVSYQSSRAVLETTSVTNQISKTTELSATIGKKDVLSFELALSHEWGKTWGNSKTSSIESTYEEAARISQSNSHSTSMTFDETYQKGYYRYVFMGDLDVFVYIVKDSGGNYYLKRTSSVVSYPRYKWDYSPDDPSFGDYTPGNLNFDMDRLSSLLSPTEVTDLEVQDGTESSPILISSLQDFKQIARIDNPNNFYKLTNDIDWEEENYFISDFYGHLDGNGYSFKNVNMKYTYGYENVYAGIFGVNHGTIKNLKIENSTIVVTPDWINKSRYISSGVIVGMNDTGAILDECVVENSSLRVDSSDIAVSFEKNFLSDPRTIGISSNGWVEWITQSYDNHVNNGTNWDNLKYEMYVGGIVGQNKGNLYDCEFYGSIESNLYNMDTNGDLEQIQYTGGIIGLNIGNTYGNLHVEATFKEWLELDNNGNGYGWVGDFYPTAKSYAGAYTGFNAGGRYSHDFMTNSALVPAQHREYAPQYAFLQGANYNSSTKGHSDRIDLKVLN